MKKEIHNLPNHGYYDSAIAFIFDFYALNGKEVPQTFEDIIKDEASKEFAAVCFGSLLEVMEVLEEEGE